MQKGQSNKAKFNQLLNRCSNPLRVYNALMALAEPDLKQSNDMGEKRQVFIGKINAVLREAEGIQIVEQSGA